MNSILFRSEYFQIKGLNYMKELKKGNQSLVNDKLINELDELIMNNNLEKNHPILKAVNYKQAFMVLNGSLKESEMLEKSIFGTRQLAKRQITWMRSWQDLNFLTYMSKTLQMNSLKRLKVISTLIINFRP